MEQILVSENATATTGETCQREVRFTIYVVSSCFVCTIGIVGNSALLLMLLRSKASSMNSLLFALTLMDIVFLTATVIVIFFFEMRYMHSFLRGSQLAGVVTTWIVCYIIRWSQLAGIWITVQIAFERWLAISRPMKGRLSVRQTKGLLAAVVVFSVLYELPDFLCMLPNCDTVVRKNSSGADYEEVTCELKAASWATFEYEMYFVGFCYSVMSFAIPLVSVISFNFMTFRTIRNVRIESASLRHSGYRSATDTRHTMMVVLISVIFLLIEMPGVSCRVILGLRLINMDECTADSLYSAGAFCAMLYASVNFVLYCVCSKRHRQRCRTNACICLHRCHCRKSAGASPALTFE